MKGLVAGVTLYMIKKKSYPEKFGTSILVFYFTSQSHLTLKQC